MDRRIRCVVMRGGTSKAVLFASQDLPSDPGARDETILAAFGSPDVRQIDGLGGADPLTSKVAVVARSAQRGADVDYTFGQVGILKPVINYRVNCGNTAAAVGVYAIEEGLVQVTGDSTRVRIWSTNSSKRIVADVPTQNGRACTQGDFRECGVPRPGAEIRLAFLDPAGGVTGRLLPTGSAVDEIELGDGSRCTVSVVDCGNLYAILPAEEWSLTGAESPAEIEAVPGLMARIEQVRDAVCRQLLPADEKSAGLVRSARLKIALVGKPASYRALDGESIGLGSMDVVARVVNQERVHKAFAVTGAICMAAAASITGTVVSALCAARSDSRATLRVGHPQGVLQPVIDCTHGPDGLVVHSVELSRTARRIMDGYVHVPAARAPS